MEHSAVAQRIYQDPLQCQLSLHCAGLQLHHLLLLLLMALLHLSSAGQRL
jgi:hypothetical protein